MVGNELEFIKILMEISESLRTFNVTMTSIGKDLSTQRECMVEILENSDNLNKLLAETNETLTKINTQNDHGLQSIVGALEMQLNVRLTEEQVPEI